MNPQDAETHFAVFSAPAVMPERRIVHGTPADTVFYGLLQAYWNQTAT